MLILNNLILVIEKNRSLTISGRLMRIYFKLIMLFVFTANFISAQTTGKIAGRITDSSTGEPLLGVNIFLEGTSIGAASDISGEFFIINIPPGKYSVKISMIGFQTKVFQDLVVSVNRTLRLDVELGSENIEMEEIVVSVSKISEKKDLTSSVKNVSADQIEMLPVENVSDVVGMQAGVVAGHFRGGRLTEVSYLVDGVSVDEGFNKTGTNVNIETESVQDLEVITGTFNAEYGRAMSGIVNVVTKEGGNEFKGSIISYSSNYITSNTDVFIGNKTWDFSRNFDSKVQLEGPILKDFATFFVNLRLQSNNGYLNGVRRFNVNDYTNFSNPNFIQGEETPWNVVINDNLFYSEATGNNEYVPMSVNDEYSFLGKITLKPFNSFKASFLLTLDDSEYKNYEHFYKYNPDAVASNFQKNRFYLLQFNHIISNSIFHDFKVSLMENRFENYLFSDPYDYSYVADNYNSSGGGFSTGGQQKGYSGIELNDFNMKYDFTWQLNNNHQIKTGANFISHELKRKNLVVRDIKVGTSEYDDFYYDVNLQKIVFNPYEPEVLENAYNAEDYSKYPYEFSAYIQDKMEYDNLVVNFGIRYDYFNSNTVYPSQWRNPANQINFENNPERMSQYLDSEIQSQISPRFGLSYTLGEAAVLHFSYGHFFQMPPLYALFQNSRFQIPSSDFSTILGNPNLKAEKTVQYEMGIWQEIVKNMGIELSVYYRDIYDLQSAVIITTYDQVKYGLYSNKDYGNVKGFEIKYDYLFENFSVMMNYTLQFTRGNADSPNSNFSRAGENKEDLPTLVPLQWDQRHTFNLTAGYNAKNLGVGLTLYYNSGLAYSYVPIESSPLYRQYLYPNNQSKPANFTVDLKSFYILNVLDNIDLRFSLSIYNLFDSLNEYSVYSNTGRAYNKIPAPNEVETFRSNYNDYYDQIENPSMFGAPREVKIGLGIFF